MVKFSGVFSAHHVHQNDLLQHTLLIIELTIVFEAHNFIILAVFIIHQGIAIHTFIRHKHGQSRLLNFSIKASITLLSFILLLLAARCCRLK